MDTYKIIATGQSTSALTDFYTVPVGTKALISAISFCRTQQVADFSLPVSLAIAIGGAADSAKQYLLADHLVHRDDSLTLPMGITMNAGDVIRQKGDNDSFSINVFGAEIT